VHTRLTPRDAQKKVDLATSYQSGMLRMTYSGCGLNDKGTLYFTYLARKRVFTDSTGCKHQWRLTPRRVKVRGGSDAQRNRSEMSISLNCGKGTVRAGRSYKVQ
jgi:hypothetical protein